MSYYRAGGLIRAAIVFGVALSLSFLATTRVSAQALFPQRQIQEIFVRGDANLDGRVSLADVFAILRYLHRGETLVCLDAADTDDSGSITHADFLYILVSLFLRGSFNHGLPPSPFPHPGPDPSDHDNLGCQKGLPVGLLGGGAATESRRPTAQQGPCEDPHGGGDLEFIHFYGQETHAFPGQQDIRLPVLMRTFFGDIEGITLSLHAPPSLVSLDAIDFAGTFLYQHRAGSYWAHSYSGNREQGYLAATCALDLEEGRATMPRAFGKSIAYVTFSIPADAPVNTDVEIRFEEIPGEGNLPPITNEIVRRAEPQPHGHCGLLVHIVPESDLFVRGDANADGRVDVTDGVEIVRYLYEPGLQYLPCEDAADSDDNGRLDITDAILLMGFLFVRGPEPFPPFPYPGKDSSLPDDLDCKEDS